MRGLYRGKNGGKIDKQKKKKKKVRGGALGKKLTSTKKKEKKRVFNKQKKRERGALESAGPVAYATFATRLIRHCLNPLSTVAKLRTRIKVRDETRQRQE